MPIYLNECQYGRDPDTVGFPHLLECLGLVVVTRTRLYGLHIPDRLTTDECVTALAAYIHGLGSQPRALYGSCNFQVRYPGNGNRQPQWEAEMTEIAGLLNFHGPAYGFDTRVIAPQHGTYVEYVRNPNLDTCQIFYKRNEKMVYMGGGPLVGSIYHVRIGGFGVIRQPAPTTGATVYPQSATGLHTVTLQQTIHYQV